MAQNRVLRKAYQRLLPGQFLIKAEQTAGEHFVVELAGEFEDQELCEAFLQSALAKIH